jgi:hypothetical protein
VLPRLYYIQAGSKFIYNLKILDNLRSVTLLTNTFNLPERSRSVVTPAGRLYILGGFLPLINHFSRNVFVLDEHRAQLVPKNSFKTGRCDHAVHLYDGKIYILGGMGYERGNKLASLNDCEIYNVEQDSWQSMARFDHKR